jgi:hypothetical protein
MNGESVSDAIFTALMAAFGVIGVAMAVGARDAEIVIFGASLALMAVAFIAGIWRRRAAAASEAQ